MKYITLGLGVGLLLIAISDANAGQYSKGIIYAICSLMLVTMAREIT